jgi:hypothetical protein
VGGSFAFGQDVDDRETFSWLLQEARPDWQVLNSAVPGYGTWQSLLLLERELPRLSDPRLVIYAFMWHHEERNVADLGWLKTLSKHSERDVDVPYAALERDGSLAGHPPTRYPAWPLRERSALVTAMIDARLGMAARDRAARSRDTARRIILEMDRVAAEHGAEFVVAFLLKRRLRDYAPALAARGVSVADCAVPWTAADRVPGGTHPNPKTHAFWARCIAEAVEALRSQERPSG